MTHWFFLAGGTRLIGRMVVGRLSACGGPALAARSHKGADGIDGVDIEDALPLAERTEI